MLFNKLRSELRWKGTNVYLLFAIIIGAILRFYKLSYHSFWMDEVFSISIVRHGFYDINNPPLYYFILWVFIETLGTNEFTARLPACLFGIATIPVVFLFGKQLFSKKEGLVASFIISLSPWFIRWSQEARMYTELTFFTVLTLYFFYKAVYEEKVTFYVFSALFLILAFYTHFTSILILGIIVSWLILRKFFESKSSNVDYTHLAIFFGMFVITSLPLFFTHIPYSIEDKLSGTEVRWGVPTIGYYVFNLFSYELGPFLALFSVLGAILVVFKRNTAGALLFSYAAIPFITFALLVLRMNVALNYVINTLPAYALLSSFLLVDIVKKITKSEVDKEFQIKILNNLQMNKILSMGVLIGILIGMSNLPRLYYYYSYGDHPDWRSACSFVQSRIHEEDIVVSTATPMVEYYLGRVDYELNEENFAVFKNSQKRVWLIIDDWRIERMDPSHEIRDWLDSDCREMEHVYLITVYLFTPNEK